MSSKQAMLYYTVHSQYVTCGDAFRPGANPCQIHASTLNTHPSDVIRLSTDLRFYDTTRPYDKACPQNRVLHLNLANTRIALDTPLLSRVGAVSPFRSDHANIKQRRPVDGCNQQGVMKPVDLEITLFGIYQLLITFSLLIWVNGACRRQISLQGGGDSTATGRLDRVRGFGNRIRMTRKAVDSKLLSPSELPIEKLSRPDNIFVWQYKTITVTAMT